MRSIQQLCLDGIAIKIVSEAGTGVDGRLGETTGETTSQPPSADGETGGSPSSTGGPS